MAGKALDVLGRIAGHLRPDAGRDKGGIDARVALQDRLQVTKFPARAAFDVKHVDLFVHDPDGSLDPVVLDRDLVGERLDRDAHIRRALLVDIHAEGDLHELQASLKSDLLS